MKTCSKNLRRPQEEAAWDPSMDESLRSEDDPFLDDASGGEDFHGNPFQVDPWKKVISQTQETRWNHDVSVMGIKSIRTVQSPVIKVNKRASRRIPSSLLQLNVDGFSAKETSRENGCDLIKQAVASVEKANEIISTRRSSGLLASISKKVA